MDEDGVGRTSEGCGGAPQTRPPRALGQAYDPGIRAALLAELARPRATVAGVEAAYGVTPETLRKWRRQAGAEPVEDAPPSGDGAAPGGVRGPKPSLRQRSPRDQVIHNLEKSKVAP